MFIYPCARVVNLSVRYWVNTSRRGGDGQDKQTLKMCKSRHGGISSEAKGGGKGGNVVFVDLIFLLLRRFAEAVAAVVLVH